MSPRHRRSRLPVTITAGQQVIVWDGDEWVVVPVAAPADIWTYQLPDDPPADPEARAAARARSAEIRAGVRRYLSNVRGNP